MQPSCAATLQALFHVWTVREGKAVLGRTFSTKEAALEAVGLSK